MKRKRLEYLNHQLELEKVCLLFAQESDSYLLSYSCHNRYVAVADLIKALQWLSDHRNRANLKSETKKPSDSQTGTAADDWINEWKVNNEQKKGKPSTN